MPRTNSCGSTPAHDPRLEIAQSTLHRPPVLFLDEPTVGLDPLARKAVWEHVERLRDDYGTTIVLTTHYMKRRTAFVTGWRLCTWAKSLSSARLKNSRHLSVAGRWPMYSSVTPVTPWSQEAVIVRPQVKDASLSGLDSPFWVNLFAVVAAIVTKTLVIAELEAR